MANFATSILRISLALWFGGASLFTCVLTPHIVTHESSRMSLQCASIIEAA